MDLIELRKEIKALLPSVKDELNKTSKQLSFESVNNYADEDVRLLKAKFEALKGIVSSMSRLDYKIFNYKETELTQSLIKGSGDVSY